MHFCSRQRVGCQTGLSLSPTRQQLSDVSKWLSNSLVSVLMHPQHTCHAISWCGKTHGGIMNLHDQNSGDMNSREQREDIPLTLRKKFFQHLQLFGKSIKYGM